MAKTNWPAEVKARALELYAELGARCASRVLAEGGHPVAATTIRNWAVAAGIGSRANENRSADVQATRLTIEQRKQALAEGLLSDIERLRLQLFASAVRKEVVTEAQAVGRSQARVIDVKLSEPTFADKKAIATAAAIFIDKVQLLTGEATARTESLTDRPKSAAEATMDELAERRARRTA